MRRTIPATIIALTALMMSAAALAAPPDLRGAGLWFEPGVGLEVIESAQATPDVDQVVADMQRYYNEVRSYIADFEQVHTQVGGITQRQSGKVAFKKPGKMLWIYEAPEQKALISNGTTFWAWEPAYNQYCERPMSNQNIPTALTFLSGQGDLRAEFDAAFADPARYPSAAGQHAVELTPKTANANYRRIVFIIDATTHEVLKATVIDGLGNTNAIAFTSPVLNSPDATDERFNFTPPAGATELCGQLDGGGR